ncbi:mitochondrial import inner membrane translocase subunit TIM44-like [Liolophura sinensis]|uniref:mitochondrial import inner membrane translocase subunit TIM44-like n=1 Tax=Liolophura sinensis TaxID=3198878 RepID=UPI00315941FE
MSTVYHVFGRVGRINLVNKFLVFTPRSYSYHGNQFHHRGCCTLSHYLVKNGHLDYRISHNGSLQNQSLTTQVRHMSGQRKGFFSQVFDNIKQEFSKNKEMKESLKKFREETEKLEKSEAIQQARRKFDSIEAETLRGSSAIKKKLEDIKETVEHTEFAKKGKDFTDELTKTAGKAAESITKQGQQLGQSAAFKNISESVRAVKSELDEATLSRARTYRPPATLKMRSDYSSKAGDNKHVEANTEATGMVMHKDSRWYQSWQNFKDNNEYVTKLFDLKMKYDESDNVLIRATRTFTDKIGYLFGGMFSKTEMSEVLTEIVKIDPNFTKERFIEECEKEIIPNILEAMVRGDLEVLKDWCYEAPFNTLAHPIKQAFAAGYKFNSRVLDINNVDVAAGKIMEQGPVLVISFNAQQIMSVCDSKGQLVEGDPEKILRILYVWALCRDQEELNPRAAWKLLDISASSAEQWL